jgi:pimeloyl-ACP methyl ester carboxylesterase
MKSNEKVIYLLSGMGADDRAYYLMDFKEEKIVHIKWIKPLKSDSLSDYAIKLAEQIDFTKKVILIGTSLGGMLAVEIAKKFNIEKTILISTVKTSSEMPPQLNLFRIFPLQKLIPGRVIVALRNILRPIVFKGRVNKKAHDLFTGMLKDTDPDFLIWSMNAALGWKNYTIPENITHYHGDKDLVFPIRYQKSKFVTINGGTHVMLITKAKILSELIVEEIKNT